MGDINMATVNARITEAVHAGRLDPDQVPANLEDIKAYTAAEKEAFFAAIYPDDIIDALASGTQLPAADLELMRYMPLSVVQALPDQLQDAITNSAAALNSLQATIYDSIKPLQTALDSLQAIINDTIKDICKEAGITLDQYKSLMQLLNEDKKQNPQKYAELENGDLSDLAKALRLLNTNQPLLTQRYLPVLNGYPTNDIMAMNTTKLESNASNDAIFNHGSGFFTIKGFDNIYGAIGTPAKKILDTGMAYLSRINKYRSDPDKVNPTVVIDLMDYWETQKLPVVPRQMDTKEEQKKEQKRVTETIKHLKRRLKTDLDNLKKIEWRGSGTGKNRGDFFNFSLISSYSVRDTTLTLNFDISMARYMVNAYVMQWPTSLLLHDNRDQNGYAIGRKLAIHHSMDNNAAAGTNCTLSVKSLLAEAPDIPTIEDLRAGNQRNWKRLIKNPLEDALNKNITIAHLIKEWKYRAPSTDITYTPEKALNLSWEDYYTLVVDYKMNYEPPDQTTRRTARAAERAAEKAAEENTIQKSPKKKRGRPKKDTNK